MARRMKRTNHKIGHVRVEADHDGKIRFIAYPQGVYNKEIVFHMHITDTYSLMDGLRKALKTSRSWLDTLEERMSTPIKHQAPGDCT